MSNAKLSFTRFLRSSKFVFDACYNLSTDERNTINHRSQEMYFMLIEMIHSGQVVHARQHFLPKMDDSATTRP
jgi:hypothetical protein